MRFTSIFPGYRTCSFQYQLNSLGSIQPCCHHGAGNYSNTQGITVQSGTHSFLCRQSAHTGEVSCPKTEAHSGSRDPYPRPVSPKSQAAGSASWRPACIWSTHFRCIGTLRVVTAGELVVLSGTFTSHPMSVRRLRHLRGHASHDRYTVSNAEGWEIHLHKPLPAHDGDWTQGCRVTGAHATICAIAPFLWLKCVATGILSLITC